MSIFRLEVRDSDGAVVRKGTAWQVGTNIIVTAFHVVGTNEMWIHEGVDGADYVLTVPQRTPHELKPLDFDAIADLAVLEVVGPLRGTPNTEIEKACSQGIDESLQDSHRGAERALLQVNRVLATPPLRVNDGSVKEGAIWSAAGFPELLSKSINDASNRPFKLTGKVAAVHENGKRDDLQLTVDQGTSLSWEGTSGSAVCVDGMVVGTLTEEFSNANTLNAATMAPLLALLKRTNANVQTSQPAAEVEWQQQFLAVVEMTRADGELLRQSSPLRIDALGVSSFLKTSHELDRRISAWLLCWAAHNGLHQIVGRLLKAGCPPDCRIDESPPTFDLTEDELVYYSPGGTALHRAAEIGSLSVMRHLIDARAQLDARDRNDSTPLHVAAALRENPWRLLLLRGLAVDQPYGELPPETDDDLAFHAVRYLLRHGADPNLRDGQGQTPAELAADHPAMLGLILSHTDVGIQPALWNAASRLCRPSVDVLLKKGAELNRPHDEELLLNRAIRQTDAGLAEWRPYAERFVEYLLDRGADMNCADASGETALHVAVKVDAVDLVDSLLRRGADPNARSRESGYTPIYYARSSVVTSRLLSAGADCTALDWLGYSALDHALAYQKTEVSEVLKRHGAPQSKMALVLKCIRTGEGLESFAEIDSAGWQAAQDLDGNPIVFWALQARNEAAMRFLFDQGVPVDVCDTYGLTLLAQSLRHPSWYHHDDGVLPKLIGFLRELGADPANDGRGIHCCFLGEVWWREEQIASWILEGGTHDVRNEDGESALMRAAIWGLPAQVAHFIRRTADVDEADNQGQSALFHRVRFYNRPNDLVIANLLLTAGADLNLCDKSGMTPLMRAAASGCEEMVGWLVENGAERAMRDKEGRNACDWALASTKKPGLINWLRP